MSAQRSVPLKPTEGPAEETRQKTEGLWSQTVPLTSCVILGKLPKLSGPQFPHVYNGGELYVLYRVMQGCVNTCKAPEQGLARGKYTVRAGQHPYLSSYVHPGGGCEG